MIIWILFIAAVLAFLAIDLGVFNKTPHVISTKEASIWTGIWVSIGLLFTLLVFAIYTNGWIENQTQLQPWDAAMKYLTGYLVELSLSMDNIFVIAIIFTSFKIPLKFQHRVLFWGILGAIFFRAIMIFFGVALINKFAWITYVFGAFLLYTAVKMLLAKGAEKFDPQKSFVFRIVRKMVPITATVENERFFMRKKHLLVATPLFLVLLLIEFTDVLFALDSIPAILAITTEPFLVFSSNILAILGLRSMYFFLSNMAVKFYYLKYSLVAILAFVGLKLILVQQVHIPEWISLSFIASALALGILVSYFRKKQVTDTH